MLELRRPIKQRDAPLTNGAFMVKRNGFFGLSAAVLCLLAPIATLTGATRIEYEFDSLLFLCTDAVEAEIIRHYEAFGERLTEFRITSTYKGKLKKGDSVSVTHIQRLAKKKEGAGARELPRLQPGDRLALCLERARPSEALRIPDDAVIHQWLSGGIWLLDGDHVFPFSQH